MFDLLVFPLFILETTKVTLYEGEKRLGRKKRRKGLSKKESLYGILLAVVIVSILFTYFLLRSPLNQTSKTFQFQAAIVDHLSFLQQPNPAFIKKATNILEEAGFTVDYYPGEDVKVNFYRNLPSHGYGLIILRVHSAIDPETTALALFTSELYNEDDYKLEQVEGQVGGAQISPGDPIYFGVGPLFVLQCMDGSFHDTIVIMMGCDGLKYTQMAEAFIRKGAKVYISWDGPVSTSHTDQTTIQLLEHLITENQTIKQTVAETMKEVGPDPVDESILQYYPTTPEAENYVIPEPESNLTTNVAEINPETVKFKKIISSKTRNNSKN